MTAAGVWLPPSPSGSSVTFKEELLFHSKNSSSRTVLTNTGPSLVLWSSGAAAAAAAAAAACSSLGDLSSPELLTTLSAPAAPPRGPQQYAHDRRLVQKVRVDRQTYWNGMFELHYTRHRGVYEIFTYSSYSTYMHTYIQPSFCFLYIFYCIYCGCFCSYHLKCL